MIQITKHRTNSVPRKHRNAATDQERTAWSMLVYPLKSRDDLLNYVNSIDDLDLDVKTNGAIEIAPVHRGEGTAGVSTRNAIRPFDYPPQIPCNPTQSVSFKTGRAGLGRAVSADRRCAVSCPVMSRADA